MSKSEREFRWCPLCGDKLVTFFLQFHKYKCSNCGGLFDKAATLEKARLSCSICRVDLTDGGSFVTEGDPPEIICATCYLERERQVESVHINPYLTVKLENK